MLQPSYLTALVVFGFYVLGCVFFSFPVRKTKQAVIAKVRMTVYYLLCNDNLLQQLNN